MTTKKNTKGSSQAELEESTQAASNEELKASGAKPSHVLFEDVTSGAFDDDRALGKSTEESFLPEEDEDLDGDEELSLQASRAEPSKRVLLPQSESPKLHKVNVYHHLVNGSEQFAMN